MGKGILNYDAVTANAILDTADKLRQQTTSEEAETVQVYDTEGNPHKIAKEELLKKSALVLPSIDDISKFVAINEAGDAVGFMTKEQVSVVLASLINTEFSNNKTYPFMYRAKVDINTDANTLVSSGFYAVYCYGQDISSKHYPIELGHIIVFCDNAGGSVSQLAISSGGNSYTRMRWGDGEFSIWRQLT